ncbi:MAG: putative transporter, permease protein, partial [Phycisphaerales bacterium]|nr:putative transporter, permease protein [Phycisphaerales bacterium]
MPLADVLHTFQQYGWVHLTVLAAIAAAAYLLPRRRRGLIDEPARRRLDVVLGVVALVIWVASQIVEFTPGRYAWGQSLPIQLCDIVGLAAPLALWSPWRVWRVMLYYWGIGLSTQALITPELVYGLASIDFWSFWLPHGAIVAIAVYDLVGRGYRPGWRDYGLALATLTVYFAAVLPFDVAYHVNYGFVGEGMPGQASVIDFLGPWPLRVYKLVVGVILFLAAITVPWVVAARRRRAEGRDIETTTTSAEPVTPTL